ncbi:MAG TPA: hypothetical protein VGM56_16960 [Byssovorax sp.]|jgi:hypothetical protein
MQRKPAELTAFAALLALGVAAAGACNAVTGAGDLHVGEAADRA